MNLSALVTLLANDARYDAAVRAGNNAEVVRLLNETSAGGTARWRDIPVDDFLAAIADQLLTPTQEERIRTYTQNRSHVPTSKAAVRQWIQNQGWSAGTIAALRALAERPARYCDSVLADDEDAVTIHDVRRAVRRVSKSLIIASGQAALEG